ncbi:chemotaxis protein CheW [Tahibacter amnicola]|uniref:Chemotaxis protein CheW n=1 Tax=Tahibacter amnicola TaxID=2976241 RepID=A0ABY6B9B5_9GAMM|nr:chemotaxis protein CheW [Tahibacter amnicola]UXI66653.1 chemotaxis protein CheW [Tahibacter amnicola]
MSMHDLSVATLRENFDNAFARAWRDVDRATEDFLFVRVRDDPYAIKLSEIAHLSADRPLMRLPGGAREALGLAAVRGTLVTVYDLGLLLGQGGGAAPRWMVVSRLPRVLGLAFDRLDGHRRVPASAVSPITQEQGGRHATEMAVNGDDGPRPVVSVRRLLDLLLPSVSAFGDRIDG